MDALKVKLCLLLLSIDDPKILENLERIINDYVGFYSIETQKTAEG